MKKYELRIVERTMDDESVKYVVQYNDLRKFSLFGKKWIDFTTWDSLESAGNWLLRYDPYFNPPEVVSEKVIK